MALSRDLLEILACPRCKQSVAVSSDSAWLVCENCGVRYPVQDDIPIMLPEEAQPLEA
ncbi:MAG: Trm112 family protein [Desulfarculus sp.]|nr:Trm112 family protein [Pseudomonadota bacterium]MBV1714724.1 Trm112 family protein [Desulfarculus sp.]MBU4574845.1 Trm112 family protein [Pseudomonadota bacterium]MBU4600060.1 Trm112 family protein [Pseudomonadota bacterium]MBV1736980.1 Trm112 family protein [Desulfarculus sp.]